MHILRMHAAFLLSKNKLNNIRYYCINMIDDACKHESVYIRRIITFHMKKILLPLIAALACSVLQAQVSMPQPSPTVTVAQNFGVGTITLVYSRPSIKG